MGTLYQFPYRTVAEISLSALLKNLSVMRTLSRKEVIPVVKADAYGHGMLPISRALVARGSCHTLAVATLEEGIELRKKIPYAISILVLSGFYPHLLDAFLRYRLTPVIHSLNHLKSLVGRKHLPEIHLKIDTGMHRLGINLDEVDEALPILERLGVKLGGLASHFAESAKASSNFTDKQIEAFFGVHQLLLEKRLLATDAKIHVSNSAGILRSKLGPSVAVRSGLGLYGISPNPQLKHSNELRPVLSWKARVVTTKEIKKGETVGYDRTYRAKRNEQIAIVSVGYADGYPRSCSNRGSVLIGGKKAAIRGRVSMDLMAVDCTGLEVRDGSNVILIGEDHRTKITAWDVAMWADTIPYEITCGVSSRVPRLYLD